MENRARKLESYGVETMQSESPYRTQPDYAFWSRSVANGFDPTGLVQYFGQFLIGGTDRIVSAGSCFASNIVAPLELAGFTYVRTELLPEPFASLPENLGYRGFSANYGNVYTARQMLQLLQRCDGTFIPVDDRYTDGDVVRDLLRPGLQYPAEDNEEFNLITDSHLSATRRAFEEATVFIFTLGLTECWRSVADGCVYPSCPGTIAGIFSSDNYEFYNFSVAEIVSDLKEILRIITSWNPNIRMVVTVSPVPLVATATDKHVLAATTYSKSVLRVAAGEFVAGNDLASYFPAYEIITGPQAPFTYFENDRRNVSLEGINAVMQILLSHCETKTGILPIIEKSKSTQALSHDVTKAECDEVAMEW